MGVWGGTRAYLNHLANIKPFSSSVFTPYFSSSLGDYGQITALSIVCTNSVSVVVVSISKKSLDLRIHHLSHA